MAGYTGSEALWDLYMWLALLSERPENKDRSTSGTDEGHQHGCAAEILSDTIWFDSWFLHGILWKTEKCKKTVDLIVTSSFKIKAKLKEGLWYGDDQRGRTVNWNYQTEHSILWKNGSYTPKQREGKSISKI